MQEIYSVLLVGQQWLVYRGEGHEPEAAFPTEQDAVAWCEEDAIDSESSIRVYQGSVCGP